MKKTGMLVRIALMAAVLILLPAQAVLADDTTRFVPGTKVNGIGIGGLTVDEAKAQIEGFYSAEYKLTIKERDGKTETLKGGDVGYKAAAPDGLSSILDAQNASGRVSGPSTDNSHTMSMSVQYDEGALTNAVNGLGCISGADIVVTQDAHITAYQEGTPFTIIPEVQGNNVDQDKVLALVKEAVKAGSSEVDLAASGCYATVRVTAEDAALKDLCDTMNRCRDMVITYQFGDQTVTLEGETICTWILGSTQDGLVDVNYDKAAAFVKSMADQFDTAGKTRVFHTTTGKDLNLTGPYGWQIDQAGETASLIAMIRTGQSQAREPLYSKKGQDRTVDWGNTYVEIDLTSQHVYMYQDGNLAWDAPCVTGNVSKNYTTPEGIYSLTYKQADRILRGEKKADGTYEYESHVDYWMPFNGGIGLHDASWRSKFGGTIYQYGGSHGCINLPPAKAKTLYDMVYTGIPVICYN